MTEHETPELMTVGEVARAFRVDTTAVTRWATQGRLTVIFTPGHQRRFLRSEIEEMMKPVPRSGAGHAEQA